MAVTVEVVTRATMRGVAGDVGTRRIITRETPATTTSNPFPAITKTILGGIEVNSLGNSNSGRTPLCNSRSLLLSV